MNDWFRSWHGAPTDAKWRTVAKRAGVSTALVVAVAWSLMDRASQAEDRGSIAGLDHETLADFLDCEPEDIARIISVMEDKGVVSEHRLKAWDKRQPKREDGSADRSKQWRENKKANANERLQTQSTNLSEHANAKEHRIDKNRLDTDESRVEESRPESSDFSKEKSSVGFLPSLGDGQPPIATGSGEEPRKPAPHPKATRLATNWKLPEAGITYARSLNVPDSFIRTEAEKFRDYWTAKPGKEATKVDWDATWRTWIRNALNRGGGGQPKTELKFKSTA